MTATISTYPVQLTMAHCQPKHLTLHCFCNRSSRQDISISWGASGQGQRQQSRLVDDYTMSTPASDAPTVSVIIAVTCSDWPSDFLSIFVSLVTMAVDRIFLQPLLRGLGEGVRNPGVPRTLFTCTDWIQSNVLHTLQTGGSSWRRRQSAGFEEPFMLTFQVNSIKSTASAGAKSDVKDKTIQCQLWISFYNGF